MPGQSQPIRSTPTGSHRFHLLDALRGVAALLVTPSHVPAYLVSILFYSHAYLAVDFFFCLSGFVICYSYENRLRDRLSLRDFLVARIIRLYPLAILGTVATILYTGRHLLSSGVPHGQLALAILLSLLLLPKLFIPWLGDFLFPFNLPCWSLFFEMVANIGYAILVRLRLASSWILTGIALLIAGMLVATFSVSTQLTQSARFQLVAVALLLPSFVYAGSIVELPSLWTKACAFLGDMSYPLYVLHVPLLEPFYNPLVERLATAHSSFRLLAAPAYLLLLALIAWWIGKHLDVPVRKLLTSRYHTNRQPTLTVTT